MKGGCGSQAAGGKSSIQWASITGASSKCGSSRSRQKRSVAERMRAGGYSLIGGHCAKIPRVDLPLEPDATELNVRPGTQAGWTIPLMGTERCEGLGHELDSTFSYRNGLLVGYCCRCEARVEIPWFKGGTVSVLASEMASQAVTLAEPSASVLDDLRQVEGLLNDDLADVERVLAQVRRAREHVTARRTTSE